MKKHQECRCGCSGNDALHEASLSIRGWLKERVEYALTPVVIGKLSKGPAFGERRKAADSTEEMTA